MKGDGWGRNRWIFLLLCAMGAALFLLGGLFGARDGKKSDYAGYLEERARERALERGLLEQADENAKRIVENFIGGFLNLTKYDILWEAE